MSSRRGGRWSAKPGRGLGNQSAWKGVQKGPEARRSHSQQRVGNNEGGSCYARPCGCGPEVVGGPAGSTEGLGRHASPSCKAQVEGMGVNQAPG